MAKDKKKLSKSAKAARKILEDSKLLATAKSVNESNSDQAFKPKDVSVKTSAPNKMRPDKKRG